MLKLKRLVVFCSIVFAFVGCGKSSDNDAQPGAGLPLTAEVVACVATEFYAFLAQHDAHKIVTMSAESCNAATVAVTEHLVDTTKAKYPNSMAVSPDKKFLYVSFRAGSHSSKSAVGVYAINADGSLTQVEIKQINGGSSGYGKIAVAPNGKYLWVTNRDQEFATIYTINTADGKLTFADDFSSSAYGLAIHSNSEYIYLASKNVGLVWNKVNPNTGVRISNGTVGLPATTSSDVALNAAEDRIYMTRQGSNKVYAWSITTFNTFTDLAPGGVAAGDGPSFLIVRNSALLVGNEGANDGIMTMALDANGVPAAGATPANAGVEPQAAEILPGTNYLFSADHDGDMLFGFSVDSAGALTELGQTPMDDVHDILFVQK